MRYFLGFDPLISKKKIEGSGPLSLINVFIAKRVRMISWTVNNVLVMKKARSAFILIALKASEQA